MSGYNAGNEISLTSDQLIQRHMVLAQMKTAEQLRVANVLAALRLAIEHPETCERIEQADIEAALEDRIPLTAKDFVTRVIDGVDVFDESWTSDERIEDGAFSATPLQLGGRLQVGEAFPDDAVEYDAVVIRTAQGEHYVQRADVLELIRQLESAEDRKGETVGGAIERYGVKLAPGRLYALTLEEATTLRVRLKEVLEKRDAKIIAAAAKEVGKAAAMA